MGNINVNINDTHNLWEQYLNDPIIDNRNKLIVNYYPYVRYIAKKVYTSYNLFTVVDLNDLVSYGIIGLIDAIDKFDTTKKTSFTSYAAFRIRGAIIDELRKFDLVPRSIRNKVRNVKHMQLNHLINTGDFLCINQIAEHFSKSKLEQQQIINTLGESITEEYNADVIDITNEYYDMDEDLEKMFIEEHVQECIRSLSKKQQTIIYLYFYEHKTLNEISDILEMSEPGVLMQKRKALNLLERVLDKDLLKDIIPKNEDEAKPYVVKNSKLKYLNSTPKKRKNSSEIKYFKEAVI